IHTDNVPETSTEANVGRSLRGSSPVARSGRRSPGALALPRNHRSWGYGGREHRMVAAVPTLILGPFRAKRPHPRRRIYIMNHRMKSTSVLRIALSREEGPKELIQTSSER